jgi:hypothetical protein
MNPPDRKTSVSLSVQVKAIWNLVVLPLVITAKERALDRACEILTSAAVPSTDHQKAYRTRCHPPCRLAMMTDSILMDPHGKDALA